MQDRRNISSCRGRTVDQRFLLIMVEGKNMICSGWKNRLSCLRLHSKENRRIEDFSTLTVSLRRKAFYGEVSHRKTGDCEDGLPECSKLVFCKAVCQKIE